MQYIQSCKYSKRNLIGKIILLLQPQQCPLAVEAAGIAGEAAIGTDHTVTGNNNGDRVTPHSTAHRLCGATSKTASQLTVGYRLTVGYGKDFFPHTLLERGTTQR